MELETAPQAAVFRCDHERCERGFSTIAALNYHKRSCLPSKKRLSGVLTAAKEIFEQRKKARSALRAPFKNAPSNPNPGADSSKFHGDDDSEPSSQTMPAGGQAGGTSEDPAANEVADQQPGTHSKEIDNIDLPIAQRKSGRTIQTPARFRDEVPQPLAPFAETESPPAQSQDHLPESRPVSEISMTVTAINTFGLFRRVRGYPPPTHDPEDDVALENLTDAFEKACFPVPPRATKTNKSPFFPYPNQSSFALGEWYWNHGAQKTHEDFRMLVDIIKDPSFQADDIKGTKWSEVNSILGAGVGDDDHGTQAEWLDMDEGWRRTPITIDVPFHHRTEQPGVYRYCLGELYHRSITSVLKERLTDSSPTPSALYYEPYELFWKPGEASEVRVYGELYTSQVFLESYWELLRSAPEPGCNAPRTIVGLMFWSDATHLTSFGQASLWPAYMFIGNNSKYQRCRPSSNLSNHIAYFQKLPDSFKDFASEKFGGSGPTKDLIAHCNREAFHAQWEILLDEEFLLAWEHGILICCGDGVTRRVYPRIFTYSADYPEKALIAGIRRNGAHPCPRCLIKISEIPSMGTVPDLDRRKSLRRTDDHPTRYDIQSARSKIYNRKKGKDGYYAVKGEAVEGILKSRSLVPIETAFSKRLSGFNFDFYTMLVVDLLHEFELGVWRALFIQLIRILYARGAEFVHELDRRYRQVPGFGRGVIRKFSKNVSELKKMAARDYENLLRCAIPVFDGLFPEAHNEIIQNLLFLCAHWHALAKLRMHTDHTLRVFEEVTVALGMACCKFESTVCTAYTTYELPREFEARKRRAGKKRAEKEAPKDTTSRSGEVNMTVTQTTAADDTSAGKVLRRRKKTFNLATYKYHSLADYPDMIKQYGTSDSYSTELGELEHKTPKARYRRTDRRGFIRQITQIERRQARIRRIRSRNNPAESVLAKSAAMPDLEQHHKIGKSENLVEHVSLFLQRYSGNPSVTDFIPRLKKHLLPRIRSLLGLNEAEAGDWQKVLLHKDRMFLHKTMRVNYTGYDVRRGEDVIHPGSHQSNIMLLNPDFSPSSAGSIHPFWYAKVLGIYHANVVYIGEENRDYTPRRLEFLWVRWYDISSLGSWKTRRLDQLMFAPTTSEAFGFIDPSDVLRGCHLIPSFGMDRRRRSKALSAVLPSSGSRNNSDVYVVSRFVDRDMLMRFHWGLGVGHIYASSTKDHPSSTVEEETANLNLDEEHSTPEFPGKGETNETTSPQMSDDNDDNDSGRSDHSFGELEGSSSDERYSDAELDALGEMYGDDWD